MGSLFQIVIAASREISMVRDNCVVFKNQRPPLIQACVRIIAKLRLMVPRVGRKRKRFLILKHVSSRYSLDDIVLLAVHDNQTN